MADPTNPVEPEVEDRIPLEPEQLLRALMNYVIGQRVARLVAFRSEKDGRERYVVILDNTTQLLFAPGPNGKDLVMTLVQPQPQQT